MGEHKFDFVDRELEKRRQEHHLRSLRPVRPEAGAFLKVAGRSMLNFCSNDYLGLSGHPLLKQRAMEFIEKYGAGSTASRLICGTRSFFGPVENKLAELKQCEAALIFNSGFQANISIIPALADRDSLILSDRLNHNSLIQGARLARCRVGVFRHNDLEDLSRRLKRYVRKGFSRILIVTESIFSMDGDQSDIDQLVAIAKAFGAILIVDEAHATGVAGPGGMGLTCGKGVDVVIGTFSKGCGVFGAYVACSRKLAGYLVNCCSGLIFSTALPPAVLGSISAALDLIPGMENERRNLRDNSDFFRAALGRIGRDFGASTTQIVPVIVGDETQTLALSQWLEDNGIFALAIRPPTVKKGTSRVRLNITATHRREDIHRLVQVIEAWRPAGGKGNFSVLENA